MESNQSKPKKNRSKGVRGIRDIRTAVTGRVRSKPQAEGQEYLDMYVLSLERARWGRMKTQSTQALEAIERGMRTIAETVSDDIPDDDQKPEPPRKRSGKSFGTFKVDY